MKKTSFDVSGLKVADILNMNWNTIKQLDRSNMARVVGRLVSAANKRLRRLQKAKLTNTPAYSYVMDSGGFFSVKGKSEKEIQKELTRLRGFLSPDVTTNTVRGARKVENRVKAKFEFYTTDSKGRKTLKKFTDTQRKKFWKAYRQLDEERKTDVYNIGSDKVQQLLRNEQVKDSRRGSTRLLEDFLDNVDLEEEYINQIPQINFYGLDGENEEVPRINRRKSNSNRKKRTTPSIRRNTRRNRKK